MTETTKTALTPKQQAFITAYLKTGNASEAYRKSYNAVNMKDKTINRKAHDVLMHPKVKAALAKVEQKSIEAAVLTRQWVLERLMRNALMALGEAPITTTTTVDGVTTTETITKVDHAAANKALELLGKVDNLGMFVTKKAITMENQFSNMSEEDLRGYITEKLHTLN